MTANQFMAFLYNYGLFNCLCKVKINILFSCAFLMAYPVAAPTPTMELKTKISPQIGKARFSTAMPFAFRYVLYADLKSVQTDT